jgi:DNA invertase Pin-like site-specific DNA recombinase
MVISIYERVSSVKQDTAAQHGELAAWVQQQEAKGEKVVWYADKQSGKTMRRPGFQRLETDIRAGKVKQVVVWRLDRLGRTMGGLTTFLEWLEKERIGFLSLKDGFDLSSASSRFTLNILASVAKFETEVRAERIAAGIAAKRARGETWGNGRPKGSYHKATAEVRKQVMRMKEQREKVAVIARVCKISRQTVYKVIMDAEVAAKAEISASCRGNLQGIHSRILS